LKAVGFGRFTRFRQISIDRTFLTRRLTLGVLKRAGWASQTCTRTWTVLAQIAQRATGLPHQGELALLARETSRRDIVAAVLSSGAIFAGLSRDVRVSTSVAWQTFGASLYRSLADVTLLTILGVFHGTIAKHPNFAIHTCNAYLVAVLATFARLTFGATGFGGPASGAIYTFDGTGILTLCIFWTLIA